MPSSAQLRRGREHAATMGGKMVKDHPRQRFIRSIENVATAAVILSRLAFDLLRYLGIGYKWISKFMWLMLYAALLMPGFLQAVCFYYLSGRVSRNIVYGNEARNTLDLYMPPKPITTLRPVVIFVTGGAWVIGYKAWGTLLGWALSDKNVIVVSLDYRNFPQGTISDMVFDVSSGVSWVFNNIAEYGGDRNRVCLVSQSAGAHISSLALVQQAEREMEGFEEGLAWRAADLHTFVGISGGYNLETLIEHFNDRGLNRSLFISMMEGAEKLPVYSPEVIVGKDRFASQRCGTKLPPMRLYHGEADISVPCGASERFAEALESAGAEVKLRILPGKTHTDLIIQDFMRGGKDEFLEDLIAVAYGKDDVAALEKELAAPPRRRMLPEILIAAGRIVSPF